MPSSTAANNFLDKCNRIYHESINYVDIGFLPFLAISRKTYNSRLVQICNRFPESLLLPINLFLSLYSALKFILLLPFISVSLSLIRILRPSFLIQKIPFLFEREFITGKDLYFIEPFVFQDVSRPTYFKLVFSQLQSSKSELRTHHLLLLDSPFRLHSLYSYTLSTSASLIPCFGGVLQNLKVLFSQTRFLIKFTIHICRSHKDLILTWLCVFPRIYSSWSFSLVFLKSYLAYFSNSQVSSTHTYVLYEGLLRDLVYSHYLRPQRTTFYSHIPFFTKAQVFSSNIRHINSSNFIFEDPNAISFLRSHGIIAHARFDCFGSPPFDSRFTTYKFLQSKSISGVIDIYSSSYIISHPPSFCSISSLSKSLQSSYQISILLLPQGFISESSSMISMVEELLIKKPFYRFILNFYISLHPSLKHNRYLLKKIQHLGLSDPSKLDDDLNNPLAILCGESSSFNRFNSFKIYPLAYLPFDQYSDSAFSSYIDSDFQRILNGQSLIDFMDYLFRHSNLPCCDVDPKN